jgi:hypothetical protein
MGRLRSACVLALIVASLASACRGGGGSSDQRSASPAPQPASDAPPWPAPPDPMARIVAAGLKPERSLAVNSHAHLDVFVNGEPVEVPAGVGVDITDPGVRHSEEAGDVIYGGFDQCEKPCVSPLHTHDTTGELHSAAPKKEPHTLGQFFVEWDVRLDGRCVGGFCEPDAPIAVYVDGERYEGDPAGIALENGREITIVIGSFPSEVPST